MPNRLIVDILDRNLARQGSGPIQNVDSFNYTDPISRVGRFRFSMQINDDKEPSITALDTVVRISDLDGVLYLGIVTRVRRQLVGGIPRILIEGEHISRELSETVVNTIAASGSNAVPTLVLAQTSGWALRVGSPEGLTSYANTESNLYAELGNESPTSALVATSDALGENWLPALDSRYVYWLQSGFTTSGYRAVKSTPNLKSAEDNDALFIITRLEEVDDAREVVNVVKPYGSGLGETRLTILPTQYGAAEYSDTTIDRNANTVSCTPAGYALPAITKALEFRRVRPISNTDGDIRAAADMLVDVARRWLQRYGNATRFYSVRVLGVRSGQLRPGMSIRVQYDDQVRSIDATLNIVEVRGELTSGGMVHDLIVTTNTRAPESADEIIAREIESARVYTALPQMGPSIDTTSYPSQPFDDDNDAEIRFVFNDAVAQVQQVVLEYRIDALRSTAKTLGGTATGSATVDIPAHSHSAPAHTHSVPAHTHNTNILDTGPGGLDITGDDLGGGLIQLKHDGSGDLVLPTASSGGTTTPSGGGTTTASGGSATVESEVDISDALTIDYGVHEESAANSYNQATTTILINGVAPTSAAVAVSGGWYRLDITPDVVDDDTLRPLSEVNTIIARPTDQTEKSARISALLQVRSILQSVAYL